MAVAAILKFFTSVWSQINFAPALKNTVIRDLRTGRFISLTDASRSASMTKYWGRIRQMQEIFPEESLSTVRKRWAEDDYTLEELQQRDADWDDVYGTSPK